MQTCPPARILKILVLLCILVPAVHAAGPAWTVPASPGVELSSVAISHDGSLIIAGGDKLIALTPNGTQLWSGWSSTHLDLSRDGNYIVTSQGQAVRLFSRQGILLWDKSPGDVVTSVSISPDGAYIVASGGKTVQSWYNSGSGLGKNTTETVRTVKISPVNDQILVATSQALRSYNISYVPNWYDDTTSPGYLAISGDGTGIVTTIGNHIRMYHGSGTLLWDRSFPGGNIICLAYSRDGSTVVAGCDDGTVLILDRDGNLLFSGNVGTWATSVGISDDGSTIATGSIDDQVHIFDRKGTLLGATVTKSAIKSGSVVVSGDGSLIVVVDLSNVYGYLRSGFTAPASPVPAGTGNITSETTPVNATPVNTLAVPDSPVPVNASVPATTATPASGLPWILTLVPLALLVLARNRRTSP